MSSQPNSSDSSSPNQHGSTDEPSIESTDEPSDDSLPAPDYVPGDQTVLPDLAGGPTQREYAFKISLPRDPEQREQLPEDINGLLLWIITDVAEENCIESLEILMVPGPEGLDIFLHPRPSYMNGNSDTQSKLDSFPRKLHSPAVSKTEASIKRRAPPQITAEFGHLDLRPVGMTDVTTTRLYGKNEAQQLNSGIATDKPLEVMFDALESGQDPFIYQVIIQESGGKLNTVVRLATYHPKDNYTGDRGFAELAKKGKPTDPARVFAKENVVSNHDGLAERYHDIKYRELIDGSASYNVSYSYERANQYTTKSEIRTLADKTKRIVLGKKENRRLRNGDTTGDPICENKFNRYKRLNLTPAQLKSFVRVVDQQWQTNPWRAVSGRSAPAFQNIDDIEIDTPAEPGPTPDVNLNSDDEDDGQLANEGGAAHQDLEVWIIPTVTQSGDIIYTVHQTTESLPDCRIESDDGKVHSANLEDASPIVPVELESTNVSKASNTMINAERAAAADRDVIFVYKQADVETGYSHLATTYKNEYEDNDGNKTGVYLYTKTDNVETTDGWTLVRRGLDETTYILRGTELTVLDGDDIIAEGDANDRLNSFEWDCHRYKKVDGTYRVETLDGELEVEYASKQAFIADWTKISEPHIPAGITYLDFSTVVYRDRETNELKLHNPSPKWVTNDRSETWKSGVKRFIDDYIVERDDGKELTYDDLDTTFSQWFESRCGYKAPPRSVIGQHLPEELSDAKTGASGNEYKYFDGFDWKMDPNLDPPNLQGPPADYNPEGSAGDDTETAAKQQVTDDTAKTAEQAAKESDEPIVEESPGESDEPTAEAHTEESDEATPLASDNTDADGDEPSETADTEETDLNDFD